MTDSQISYFRPTVILMILTIFIWLIFRYISSDVIEYVYSNGLFNCIRCSMDYTIARLPFSIGILFVVWILYRFVRYNRSKTWDSRFGSLLRCLSLVVILFYMLWGYNYKRPGLLEKLSLTPPTVDSISLERLFQEQLSILNELKPLQTSNYDFYDVQQVVRTELKEVLLSHGYNAKCRPVLRRLPKGILLRFSTAGIYNPFLGEGYIDRGLHPIQKPFVIAHELTHAFGITDEGEANFWGYLACKRSSNPTIRYSGELGFLRYILSDLYRYSQDDYRRLVQNLPPAVVKDLRAIDANNDAYPDILPAVRDAIYGSYLKSQGIKNGLRSYNDMVSYYLAWSDKDEDR